MQTKGQIRELLASAGVSCNKRFGQNFLVDLNLMRLLIDSAGVGADDVVLEVGCGTGSLTQGLAERAGHVVAVELDVSLASIAEGQLAGKDNVEIIKADILTDKHTINPAVAERLLSTAEKFAGRVLLVANLPYSAASPVMLNLVTGETGIDGMYVTVQKEVAERMTAQAGSHHYGTLSILLAVTGDTRIIRTLKPSVFWPEPQVDSAMVCFVRSAEKVRKIRNMELFGELVGLFMQHRRKMLKGCVRFASGKLSEIADWAEIFDKAQIDGRSRPEQISPGDYITIANLCHGQLGKACEG